MLCDSACQCSFGEADDLPDYATRAVCARRCAWRKHGHAVQSAEGVGLQLLRICTLAVAAGLHRLSYARQGAGTYTRDV